MQSLCLKHALPPSVPANNITSALPCPVQVVFPSGGLCLVLPQLPNSKPPFCTWLPARLSSAHLSSSTEHAAPCVLSVLICVCLIPLRCTALWGQGVHCLPFLHATKSFVSNRLKSQQPRLWKQVGQERESVDDVSLLKFLKFQKK